MGPWLANNIRLCDGMTAAMSYWTFSDVFEEQGVIKTPFYGGYGLIAEGGIPKAAFNAFAMLHRLGSQRLEPQYPNTLVTKRADGSLAVAVWNYAAPGEQGSSKDFQIGVSGWTGTPHFHVEILDREHGSAFTAWQAMGSPADPTRQQYEQLRHRATATEKLNSADVHAGAAGSGSGGGSVRRWGPLLACVLVVLIYMSAGRSATVGSSAVSPADRAFLEDLEHRAFLYFWEQADLGTGLVLDRANHDGGRAKGPSRDIASIAATGFGLTAICIGAEHGWVPARKPRTGCAPP